LLRPAWQVLGHEAELRAAGDFVSGEVAGERALIVRAERGRLHAFRNACRRRPHALVTARRGHLKSAIHCAAHGLTYTFDGRLVAGSTPGDLSPFELRQSGRLLLVRAASNTSSTPDTHESLWAPFAALTPLGVTEREVAADWKLLAEQWLETPLPQQKFVGPNQLLEVRTDGAAIMQVVPTVPGRSRVRRFEFSRGRAAAPRSRGERLRRRAAAWLREQIALAESTQAGLEGAPDAMTESGPVGPALAQFRAQVSALLQALPQEPGER
jgi:nitrite reductase/ring-hydroxylating ferredoxin subunit